jgi:hypothetical protein
MKAAFFAIALLVSTPSLAQTPATHAYTLATTTIADLLDKPALKAIFAKHLPGLANNERINEGRALTLADLVQYVPEQVTPEKLAAIDAELKVLPPQ